MKLKPAIGRYFDNWIDQDSWHSGHPLDTDRFYLFVKAVAQSRRRRGKVPSQADVHALIVKRKGQVVDNIELDKIANEFAELYQTLLDYDKVRGFPDPLIERRDIVKYYVKLRGDNQHINRMMTEVWGEDWRTKLDEEIGRSNP